MGTGTCRDFRCPEADDASGVAMLIAQSSLGLAPSPGHMRVQLEKQLAVARTLITGFFPGNRRISKPKFLPPTRESHLPVPNTYPRPL